MANITPQEAFDATADAIVDLRNSLRKLSERVDEEVSTILEETEGTFHPLIANLTESSRKLARRVSKLENKSGPNATKKELEKLEKDIREIEDMAVQRADLRHVIRDMVREELDRGHDRVRMEAMRAADARMFAVGLTQDLLDSMKPPKEDPEREWQIRILHESIEIAINAGDDAETIRLQALLIDLLQGTGEYADPWCQLCGTETPGQHRESCEFLKYSTGDSAGAEDVFTSCPSCGSDKPGVHSPLCTDHYLNKTTRL